MKVDKGIIGERFDKIERNINFLKEYKDMPTKEFIESYKDVQAAKFSLLEILEATIDIANHIISVQGFNRAESYSQMFKILGDEKVLEINLTNRLEDMARFRNLLVHRYGEIDDERFLEIIKTKIEDIIEFERQIHKYIEKREN
jgi:uncharacterized protein YutE (UPF0331/DUF86 family)